MGKLDTLWQYHEAEMACDRLETEIKTTPARQKLNKLRAFLTEQQNSIARMEKEMEAKQALLTKLSEQFDALEKKYDLELSEFETMDNDPECTAEEMAESRKEFETMVEQLNVARRELFDTLTWLEKTGKDSKETWAKAGKAKKEYDALRLICEQELEASKGKLNEARAEANKAAEAVDPEFLKRYRALKKNHAVPMAKLENNQCGGCNMSLPTVVTKKVLNQNVIVECDNCGRILYVPGEQ